MSYRDTDLVSPPLPPWAFVFGRSPSVLPLQFGLIQIRVGELLADQSLRSHTIQKHGQMCLPRNESLPTRNRKQEEAGPLSYPFPLSHMDYPEVQCLPAALSEKPHMQAACSLSAQGGTGAKYVTDRTSLGLAFSSLTSTTLRLHLPNWEHLSWVLLLKGCELKQTPDPRWGTQATTLWVDKLKRY